MKVKIIGLVVVLIGLLSSCGGAQKKISKSERNIPKSSKHIPSETVHTNSESKEIPSIEELPNPVHQTPKGDNPTTQYISLYKAIAMEEMGAFRIPASITLAQGILESGNGNSDLTRRSNNHFGIKCHDWTGDRVYHDDDARQECFRKYDNPNYSFRDHSLFLKNRPRYAGLFELPIDDYRSWAYGLKAAGYATDPRYPTKLIEIIEKYSLYQYDREALQRYRELSSAPTKPRNESAKSEQQFYVVRKGDTLYNISQRFGVSIESLKRQNNLRDNRISVGQRLTLP